MCPHCDQSGQLNCLPPKGPFLQRQAHAQWGPPTHWHTEDFCRGKQRRVGWGGVCVSRDRGFIGWASVRTLLFFLCAQMDLSAPPHLLYKALLQLPEGRGLNVTLGHQSTQPLARVSWGKHAKQRGEGERKAKGRETLALAPLSITIGMSC